MKKLSELNNDTNLDFPMIELKNNCIRNINYSTDYRPSLCDTCDLDKAHIVELHLYFNDDEYERVKYFDTDKYIFTESDLVLFFTRNIDEFSEMTKEEFLEFMENEYNIL